MTKKKIITRPGVLWITGLSGSGKTTISKLIYAELKKKYRNIILLDGDNLRKKILDIPKSQFSYKGRKSIGLRYARICKRYIKKNKYVIIAVMALIKDVQTWNKKNLKNYTDVYLNVPLKELKKRDPKKLYKMFEEKKIKNLAGIDLKYDIPKKPKIYINWKKNNSPKNFAKKIIKRIKL